LSTKARPVPTHKHPGDPLTDAIPVGTWPVDSTAPDTAPEIFLRRRNVGRNPFGCLIVRDALQSAVAHHTPGTVNRWRSHCSQDLAHLHHQVLGGDQDRTQSAPARELTVLGKQDPALNSSAMRNLRIRDLEIERVVSQCP